jgi:hypothetical protein
MIQNSIFLVLFFSTTLFVQAQHKAPGVYLDQKSNNKDLVIWSEDFANGIPSDWINQETSGIAAWEYRGPSTSPNNTVGSRGACNSNFVGPAINSVTANNGFIIFDSNYWDNNVNPCSPEFFGTGPAPGPHLAALTTPSVDLTNADYAALELDQYVRFYQGNTYIQMSVNQGSWSTFFTNTITMGTTSDNAMHLRIPIPGAANQSDVRFRFVYDGLYYFWQLDDIKVLQIAANDIALNAVHYGDFDILDPANPTGYEWMEYSQYPQSQAPFLKLWSMTENRGGLAQTGCGLQAQIFSQGNNPPLATVTQANPFTMSTSLSAEMRAGTYQMPQDTGNYKIIYRAFQNEIDEVSNDNSDSSFFRISPCVMARDNGKLSSVYMGSDVVNNQPFEMGNIMLPTAEMKAAAITVGLSNLTTANNAQIRGRVHQFVFNDSITSTVIAETPWQTANLSLTNDMGDNQFQVLNFTDTVVLNANTPYWITVESSNAPNEVFVGMAGNAEQYTSWINSQGSFYYLSRKPMIRIQSCMDTIQHDLDTTGIIEVADLSDVYFYPNPANDEIHFVNLDNQENWQLTLFNQLGEKVDIIQNWNGKSYRISALSEGIYLIELKNNRSVIRKKLVKK